MKDKKEMLALGRLYDLNWEPKENEDSQETGEHLDGKGNLARNLEIIQKGKRPLTLSIPRPP